MHRLGAVAIGNGYAVAFAIRTDRHSGHPDHGWGEVNEAEEMDGASIIPGSEASEVLEAVEALLDTIA
ncbi:hypothetical protein QMA67_13975 [Gluconobacter japonicus]|uniref:hypothetical protein n=1 Tax=Gluconobacter japonicus TaxID=376620 RepID=UPI0024ADA5EE|nr:hypothetical protein [Gluconobacter japonicus]MDI6654031.1 hypothetical protein [Gluconobacter japonicus]